MKSIISIANINLSVEVRNDLADVFYANAVEQIFVFLGSCKFAIFLFYCKRSIGGTLVDLPIFLDN